MSDEVGVPFGSAADPSQAVFTQCCTVRFSNCDPAGIVFFPQYFVLLNGVVEDWFTLALGIDYTHLIGHQRIGLPTVSLRCDFLAPSRMGEKIEFRLRAGRVGQRSITLDVECVGVDGIRLRLSQVLVTTSLINHQAIDIPPEIKTAISCWKSKIQSD